jgi:rare lipoprotein A
MQSRQLKAMAVAATLALVPGSARSAAAQKAAESLHRLHAVQIGLASWYGRQFHGKETSSGEPFNMFGFTAAHRNLPLGSVVRITNLCNGRSLLVRINDRGPGPVRRLIDVSYAAAHALGFKAAGLVPVKVELWALPGHAARQYAMALPPVQ